MAHADQARQAHGAAIDERHAKAATKHAKVGVLLHHAHVAPQRQLHPTGDCRAADGGNHRFGQQQPRRPHGPQRRASGRGLELRGRQRVKVKVGQHAGATLLPRHARAGLEVPAGTKMPMRAMKNGHLGIGIVLKSKEGRVQIPGSLAVHRIAHVRPRQGDDGDRALSAAAHCRGVRVVLGHGLLAW